MRQLMADDVDRDRKTVEQALVFREVLIAIAVDHLLAIPKRIVVAPSVMDGRVQAHTVPVNRVTLVYIVVQIIGDPAAIIRFVHSYICSRAISFLAHHRSREAGTILGVINNAILAAHCNSECRSREISQSQLLTSHTGSRFECLNCQLPLAWRATRGYVFQHVRGNDAINRGMLVHNASPFFSE